SSAGLSTKPSWTLANPSPGQAGDFSTSLAIADVNRDGFGDVIVGDPCDPSGVDENSRPTCGPGHAYIFEGGASGLGVAFGGIGQVLIFAASPTGGGVQTTFVTT